MPPVEHPCFTAFWGGSAQDLYEILDPATFAFGDARNLSMGTYMTMCSVQRAIEWAVGLDAAEIKPYLGLGSSFPPQDEALLRMSGCTFNNDLILDGMDVSGAVHHTPGAPFGWLAAGAAQTDPVNAVTALSNPPGVPGIRAAAPGTVDDLLGRVKNALGST